MKRVCITLCLLALVAASGSTALADHSLGGYYRIQVRNLKPPAFAPPDDRSLHSEEDEIDLSKPLPTGHRVYGSNTLQWITTDFDKDGVLVNRLAAGYRYGFTDNWSLTYAGELDNAREYHYIKQGSDRYSFYDDMNYETTRAHLDYRSQDAFHLRVGIQGMWDNLDGMVLVDNALGVKAVTRLGSVDATLMYFNLYQEDKRWDDGDIYGLQLQLGSQDSVGIAAGLDFYLYSDKWNDIIYLGLHTDYDFGSTTVGGAFVYAFGEVVIDPALKNDYSAYAATLKASTTRGALEMGGRLFYFSGDDKTNDDEMNNFFGLHSFPFANDGSMIFMQDAQKLPQSSYGLASTVRQGTMGASISTGWSKDSTYLSTYLGYFSTVKDSGDSSFVNDKKYLGTEIAMRLGYTFDLGLDLSLNGAKAFLGDFFDVPPGSGQENPDDIYLVYATVKMPFSVDF